MKQLDPIHLPLTGTHLIEASAGTGKTYTITTLILRLLLESAYGIDEILVVTYTRAATGELRDRVRRRIGDGIRGIEALQGGREVSDPTLAALLGTRPAEGYGVDLARLRAALRRLDEAAIFTIHGFCQRALSEWAFESGLPFETELSEEPWAMLVDVVRDFWANRAYDASPLQLQYWNEHGASLAALTSLARRVTSNPNLHVVPERLPPVELPDSAAFERLRRPVVECWAGQREAILALLVQSDGLHRGSYKVDSIAREWAPGLDRLDAVRPGNLPKWFGRLGLSTMQGKIKKNKRCPEHVFFSLCDDLWAENQRVATALSAEVLGMRLSLAQHVGEALNARKRAQDVLGFDDLLLKLDAALAGPRGHKLAGLLRARYRVALIDEFQDTDPMQYRIFRAIYPGADDPLMLIGDPKQAIYGFRGADVFAYLQAAADVGEQRHTLSVNYRSDPGVLAGIEAMYTGARDPFLFESIAFHPVDAAPGASAGLSGPEGDRPLQWLWLSPESLGGASGEGGARVGKAEAGAALPALVAGEIARLLASAARIEGAPVRPRDIAVLCRTNRQARLVQAALRQLGVPSVLQGDDSVFDTPMAEELTRVLSALAQPSDQAAVRAALVTSVLGVDAEGLQQLQVQERLWDDWLSRMHGWSATWHQRGLFPALHQLLAGAEVQHRLLRLPDGERRLTDLLHLVELLHQAEGEQHLGPLSLLAFLRTVRLDESQRGAWTADSAQVRLESDAHAVQLTTVHKSKGLEYPIVYCPFLWDGSLLWGDDRAYPRYHDPAQQQRNSLDLGSADQEAHVLLAKHEALAEQLRLTYVALTRAKHRCYVVWGALSGSQGSGLAYLLHQGPESEHGETVQPGDSAALARARAERVSKRVAKLPAEALFEELDAVGEASGGAAGVRPIATGPAPQWEVQGASTELSFRHTTREADARFRVASFTSLTGTAASAYAAEAPDHDGAESTTAEAGPGSMDAPAPSTLVGPVALAAFPAGARVGSMMHHVYEHFDFTGDAEMLGAQVDASLRQFGFDSALGPALADAVAQTLRVPLGPPDSDGSGAVATGPCLRDVARADRLDELEFTLQVGRGRAALSPRDLAALLTEHGAPSGAPGYAKRLAQLSAQPLTGFLRGYIDLLFRADGRYYVVDYKSNRLGPDASDYALPRLHTAMAEHHYYLQYLLYVVAVHNYLGARLPDYDYGRDFGGVAYLFIRGASPEHPPGCGVYFDRPTHALVQGLADRIAGGAMPAGHGPGPVPGGRS